MSAPRKRAAGRSPSPVAALPASVGPRGAAGTPGSGVPPTGTGPSSSQPSATNISPPVAGTRTLAGGVRVADRAPSAGSRSWTIELPAALRLLSANDRYHWAERGRVVRDIRKAAWACAKAAGIPPLERARIAVEYQPPPTSRRRDFDNVAPVSGKHAIDGLVDARVLPDDSHPQHVARIDYAVGQPYPRGRLVLRVTEEPS